MSAELQQGLTERRELIEARADPLLDTALTEKRGWTAALGTSPEQARSADAWRQAACTVAAYRDRYGITDTTPLGAPAESDTQKIDAARARAALDRAQNLTQATHREHEHGWRTGVQRVGGRCSVGAYSSESARRAAGRLVRRCERCGQVVLNGDQLGDLGGNVCDRIIRRVQPISGGKQRADLPELVVGRLVHDRDQQVACKELRELFVRDPPAVDTLQQRRSDQNETRTRLRQAPCRSPAGTVGRARCPSR